MINDQMIFRLIHSYYMNSELKDKCRLRVDSCNTVLGNIKKKIHNF